MVFFDFLVIIKVGDSDVVLEFLKKINFFVDKEGDEVC